MKILLVSNLQPPSQALTNSFLRQLCSWLPKENLSAFFLQDLGDLSTIHPDFADINHRRLARPPETHKRSWPGKSAALQCFLKELYVEKLIVRSLIKDVSSFAKKNNIEVIWFLLQGQTMFRVARGVQKKTRIPTITQVIEPPESTLHKNHTDGFSRMRVMRNFSEVISKSKICATASWAMADAYRVKYGVETVPVLPSVDRSWAQLPADGLNENNQLFIGYAGHSIACAEEWRHLLKMLDFVQWKIHGKEVIIKVIGNSSGEHARKNIQHIGERRNVSTVLTHFS